MLLAELWNPPAIDGPVIVGDRQNGKDHLDRDEYKRSGITRLARSVRVPLTWRVSGDTDWLRYWPDATAQGPVADEVGLATLTSTPRTMATSENGTG